MPGRERPRRELIPAAGNDVGRKFTSWSNRANDTGKDTEGKDRQPRDAGKSNLFIRIM